MKKALLDQLSEVLESVEYIENKLACEYVKTGYSDTQRWHWKRTDGSLSGFNNYEVDEDGNRIKELEFDEDGSPLYEEVWGYVPRKLEEISDSRYAEIMAIREIKEALEKLI